MKINVPASIGELFDKITILEIKKKKIKNKEKLKHVKKELDLLNSVVRKKNINKRKIYKLVNKLMNTNVKLWNVEDKLRKLEKQKSFKSLFILKARSVYILNDKRSVIKNDINQMTNSDVNEVKSYEKY